MTTKPITESYNLYDLTDFEEKVEAYLESVTDSETGEINADPEEMMAAMAAGEGVGEQIETVLEHTCKSIRNQELRIESISAAYVEVEERMLEAMKPFSSELEDLHEKSARIMKDIDWRKGALRYHLLSKGKLEEGKRAGLYPKIDLGTFRLGIRTSKSVHVPDDADLEKWDNSFVTIKRTADRKALKAELEAGEGHTPMGVTLVEMHALTIK